VRVESPDYQPVTGTVQLVGGRTTDMTVTLAAILNGSILVTAHDKASGASIGAQVDAIAATGPGTATTTVNGVRQSNGQWLMAGLAPGRYNLAGTAAGYRPASMASVGPVPATGQFAVTLDFDRVPTAPGKPERCIAATAPGILGEIKTKKVRLCMVTAAAVFEARRFGGKRPARTAELSAPGTPFSVAQRKTSRPGFQIGGDGELLYDESRVPWRDMTRWPSPASALVHWLDDWRDWLAFVFADSAIAAAAPALYVDRRFKPPATELSVRETPPAYAVFGPMAVPVSIGVEEKSTRGPVDLREAALHGLPEEYYEKLRKYDIRTINDLVWLWEEVMVDITGDTPHLVDLTIDEAKDKVPEVNQARIYYQGMTETVNVKLIEAGFDTDRKIADAGVEALADAVGSKVLAARLQMQAKGFAGKM